MLGAASLDGFKVWNGPDIGGLRWARQRLSRPKWHCRCKMR